MAKSTTKGKKPATASKAKPKVEPEVKPAVEESETKVVERPKAKVIANKLNLRTDATREASVMAILNKGTVVELIATDEDCTWSMVSCEPVAGVKMEGFVMSEFLEGI